jgi:pyruvate dehydrogenase E2 component (dihydrolipoamide acetyltransferase)
VRELARQLGVDLERIVGSGPDGLVTRDDIAAAADRGPAGPASGPASGSAAGPAAADVRIPIRGVRRRTAEAMVVSAFTAPHATVWTTVDVTPTMDLVARWSGSPQAEGTRITLLAVVARAACIVLRRHPELNSSWDGPAQEIVQHGEIRLGIAAATPRGLVVPNIPDAGSLDLLALARALAELTEAARAGRTEPARLVGGTFTITNVGVFGVEGGTPILNPGEAGILAVGAVRRRPWEHEGGVALRQVLTLSLSFDHRLVDGEQGARFLAELGALLSDPGLALLLA